MEPPRIPGQFNVPLATRRAAGLTGVGEHLASVVPDASASSRRTRSPASRSAGAGGEPRPGPAAPPSLRTTAGVSPRSRRSSPRPSRPHPRPAPPAHHPRLWPAPASIPDPVHSVNLPRERGPWPLVPPRPLQRLLARPVGMLRVVSGASVPRPVRVRRHGACVPVRGPRSPPARPFRPCGVRPSRPSAGWLAGCSGFRSPRSSFGLVRAPAPGSGVPGSGAVSGPSPSLPRTGWRPRQDSNLRRTV